jgi:predicted MFS family arabinose efflux permease
MPYGLDMLKSPRREFPALVVMVVYSLLGNTAMMSQPMLVGGLVDFLHFSEKRAGFVAAAEMAGFALGMLLLARYVTSISRRLMAVLAVAGMAIANLLAAHATGFPDALLLCALSGVGAAMSYSVYLTMAAGSAAPENSFAIVNATSIAFSGIFQWLAPHIMAGRHLGGLFDLIAGFSLFCLLFVPAIPHALGKGERASAADSMAATPQEKLAVVLVLLTMGALYTGHGAIWAFQERIGVEMGIPHEQVGRLLGLSMLVWGVLGSVIAACAGLAIGRIWPQILSLGASIVAALLLVTSSSPWGFGLACALVALTWFYGLPYQMGLLAHIDRSGRANLLGSMATTGGAAAGPAIAALLVGVEGHRSIGVLAGVCYALALGFVLPPALMASRETRTLAKCGK